MAGNSVLAKMAVIISAQNADFNRAMANSSKSLRSFEGSITKLNGLLRSFGVGFGIYEIARGIQNTISIMANFEHTMSEVKAITGAVGDDFKSLRKDALQLGSSTKFTASQVGQLQIAYGRLGFTTKEILNATSATLDLAAATGEDLAKSADVAGSTVRGFALNAAETQRVVDVMASSFNKTALGLDNFTESMKYVAPVANASGATVEETTALLGTLADAGIRGSMAGTSLRKIFTDMTKDGRPLQERLAELAEKGITLQDSFDEVGRTAQTALLILSKNTGKTNELTRAFQGASGEASKMARIMQDDLLGDVTKLTSAWEGFILKLTNSEALRSLTQQLTSIVNALSGSADLDFELKSLANAIKNNITNVDGFVKGLSKVRQELGKPIDIQIVEELANKYKLTDEQVNKLYQSILEANKALSFQEKAIKQFNEFADRNGYNDLSLAIDDYKQKIYELIYAEQVSLEQLKKYTPELTKDIQATKNQISEYRRLINVLNEYSKSLEKTTNTTTGATEDPNAAAADSIEALNKRLRELNDLYDKMSPKDFVRQQALANEILKLKDKISLLETIKRLNSEDILFTNQGSAAEAFEKDINIMGQLMTSFEERVRQFRAANRKEAKQIEKAWLDIGPAVASGISTIAEGLGNAFAGVGNFGDSIVKALAGFARQVGELLIGIGTSMIVAKQMIKNPYTAIAAGVALVALAGALNAGLNKAQSNFNSGGITPSQISTRSTNINGRAPESTKIDIQGKISGYDLDIVESKEDYRRKRVG